MRRRVIVFAALVLLAFAVVAPLLVWRSLAPAKSGAGFEYFRVWPGESVSQVLERAEAQGLIRSFAGLRMYLRFINPGGKIRTGTFRVSKGMRSDALLRELLLGKPVRRMVLLREGLWLREVAQRLEEEGVARNGEVLALAQSPKSFSAGLGFAVPAKTLEGYLFPDTYDFPPLLGARDALLKMAETFNRKVYTPLGKPTPRRMHKLAIIASLVEMEAAADAERPKIAGVIYNRLAKGMRLQIDATIVYAKRKRGRVLIKEYQLYHQYNTYRIAGLPPGPICSPGAASFLAAAAPERHDYLYYVAMPAGYHLFAKTYPEHLANIARSRRAFAVRGGN